MKEFVKFDKELGTALLDEKYLFGYHKVDGFSHRLLSADFALDYDYNYTLRLKAFQHEAITTNNADFFIEEGKPTAKTIKLIESLLSSAYHTLKKEYVYEGLAITDIGMQGIGINLDKKTTFINIEDGLPIECFETPAEKKLYELNEYFKELIEKKYKNWLKQ